MLTTEWRKSSYSDGFWQGDHYNCVEVGVVAPGAVLAGMICLRDSKDPDGPVLEFTPDEWREFLTKCKTGELDLLYGA